MLLFALVCTCLLVLLACPWQSVVLFAGICFGTIVCTCLYMFVPIALLGYSQFSSIFLSGSDCLVGRLSIVGLLFEFFLLFLLRLSVLMSSSARYIIHMTCAKQYWHMTPRMSCTKFRLRISKHSSSVYSMASQKLTVFLCADESLHF